LLHIFTALSQFPSQSLATNTPTATSKSVDSSLRYDLIGGTSGSQIPEPATLLLLSTGIAGVALKIHKQRKTHMRVP